MESPVILVLGGARSGKTRQGMQIASALSAGRRKLYLATAEARDAEMAARIARHQQERRDSGWELAETPVEMPAGLAHHLAAGRTVLVDCLSLWISNLMLAGHDTAAAAAHLESVLAAAAGPVVLVSGEVGLGIVPENALARRYRDELGLLNQRVAALADQVLFVAAGLALPLKGDGTNLVARQE